MKLNRTKNAMRNSFFGIVLKIYQIIVPFIMRTIFLYTLGVQYLGLNSLFSSVLQVLNLAELGVGSAMVFSMYKPIADNDDKKVCALMNLYKKYYRIIGGVIACIGLIITPFVKYFISGEVPSDINIYLIYLLNLGATVLTYWLFAYKNSLLLAFQRNDVIHKITIVNDTVKYIFQIGALLFLRNYYAYLIIILGAQIVNNIITAIVVDKMYPQYVAGGTLPENDIKDIKQRIKDLFTAKVGGVLIAPAHTLVISACLG